METDRLEQRKRKEIAWGIIIALVASFAAGILVNAYYDLFVNVTTTWAKINQMQIYGSALVLTAIVGLLNFFIADYKNDLEVDRSFWKRYRDHFFYSFAPGKVLRWVIGLYALIIIFGFLAVLYFFMAKFSGYLIATFVFGASFLKVYLEEKNKKKHEDK